MSIDYNESEEVNRDGKIFYVKEQETQGEYAVEPLAEGSSQQTIENATTADEAVESHLERNTKSQNHEWSHSELDSL